VHESDRELLALYARDNKGPGSSKNGDLNVHKILEDWPERTSNNNQPKYSNTVAAKTSLSNDIAWKFIDVTEVVHGQAKDKRPNNGVSFVWLMRTFPARIRFTSIFRVAKRLEGGWICVQLFSLCIPMNSERFLL
jgi:hypothetical protein